MGKGLKKIAKQMDKSLVPGAMSVRERMAYNKGRQEGKHIVIEENINYFTEKMGTLSDIKGIGEKRFLLIAHHLGFQPVKENENERKRLPNTSSSNP